MKRLLFKNARIILKDRILPGNVLVEEGRIACISENDISAENASVVDAKGSYLSPGFIDLHNHGRLGHDALSADPDGLATIAKGQLAHGVTGFLITTSTAPFDQVKKGMETAAEFIRAPHPDMSIPLGIYSEGLYFSVPKRGAHSEDLLRSVSQDEFNTLIDAADDNIKIFSIAPELPGALDGIATLKKKGIVVTAAHSNATYEEAIAGINAGITCATHTFNGMRALDHRQPAVVGACLTDDRVICEAIVDGIHLHPGTVRLMARLKGADGMALVSDSVFGNGLPDGEYDIRERHITIKDGAIRLDNGTLAGSCLSLDAAVRNVMKFADIPLWDAVCMASLTPARVIGMDKTKGSIGVGKDADLVLLSDDLMVQEVYVSGQKCELLPTT